MRGHWPRGKRRSDLTDAQLRAWHLLRKKLAIIVSANQRGVPGTLRRSCRGLAEHCGVHDRSVRRWLSGEDVPTQACVEKMREWIGLV